MSNSFSLNKLFILFNYHGAEDFENVVTTGQVRPSMTKTLTGV